MSFNRVKPSGYPHGGDVEHDEMNQLDIDHANALDKVGGDTITGDVALSGVTLSAVDASTVRVAESSVLQVEDGTLHCTSSAVANIECAATFGAAIGVTGLSTLTGGANVGTHNVAFNPARVVIRLQTGQVMSNEWDAAAAPIYAPSDTAQTTPAVYPLVFELKIPHGATLTSAGVWLSGRGPHSFAPLTMPQVQVWQYSKLGVGTQLGSTVTDTSASPGGSPTGYDVVHFVGVTGLSTVIDRTANRYLLFVFSEAGTNTQHGSPDVFSCVTQCTQSNYEED